MPKIRIRYLNEIKWADAAGCDYSLIHGVDTWRINISSNLSSLEAFTTLMSPDEADRANRYFYPKDKNRFIISRGALRIILSRYMNIPPTAVEFEIGENKKPHIKNNATGLHFNLSHSGDWILLAVSNSTVGADVEFINPDYGYQEVLADNFSTAEISYINRKSSLERFFMLWTRKESLTKATAKGLDEDLKLIPSLDGDQLIPATVIASVNDWCVDTFKLSENYFASIARNSQAENTRFWDIYF